MLKFLRKHSKTILIITVLSFLGTIPIYYLGMRLAGGRAPAKKAGLAAITELAKVNGEPVNLKRFFWMTDREIRIQSKFGQPVNQISLLQTQYKILEEIINFTLVLQEAKKQKTKATSAEIKKMLENLKLSRNFRSNQQLDLFLKRELGVSLKDYKDLVKEELIAQKTLEALKNTLTKEKNETDLAFAKRQFELVDKWLTEAKNKARVEILYPHLLAIDLIKNKKPDEAIKVYQKILAASSNDLYAHLFLGQLLLEKNLVSQGLEEIKKAANLNESSSEWRDPEVYLVLAQALLKSGKRVEAKAELDKAALIAGDGLSAHQGLYLSYLMMGERSSAEKEKKEIERIRQKIVTILKAYQEREAVTSRIKEKKEAPSSKVPQSSK